jgi:hypothetical protein
VEREAADGTEVLRDSTRWARFGARAVVDRRLGALLRDAAAGFAFKRMDLRLAEGRLAAFFVGLGLDFALVAIAVRNCKRIALKSQGGRRRKRGSALP